MKLVQIGGMASFHYWIQDAALNAAQAFLVESLACHSLPHVAVNTGFWVPQAETQGAEPDSFPLFNGRIGS